MRKRIISRDAKPIRIPLNTEGFAIPKPSQSVPQQPKDGRLIQNAYQYRKTKQQMWRDQGMRCANCPRMLPSPAFGHRHHVDGRGGGKRDDRKTLLICIPCHEKAHPGPQFGRKSA